MHAIKGGWIGRPLALAKSNESEGRKTRIRRSKEERKAMVEVFIKKYQESNNGSFPSLNLTHKEVGGSFYTVREIVRDIIQENRVLGPGKWLLEEHSTDHSLEENPLHSIAIEPQSPLTISSEEVDSPVNYNQYINEEPIFVSDEQCTSTNIQGSQNVTVINGSPADMSDKDSDELKKVEEVVREESGMPFNHVTPFTTDVVVETFPLNSISWAIDSSDVRSETSISTSASEKQPSHTMELGSDVGLVNIKGNNSTASGYVVKKADGNCAAPLSETKSDLVEVAQIVETSNGSPRKEGSIYEVEGPDTPIPVISEQGQKSSETKAPNASPSVTKNLNKAFSNSFDQTSKTKEETGIENEVEAEQNGGSTLNRINLESWEGMSKNSSKPKNNPLLEIFKAFIGAFVKFWSE
ncbi:uncharacterized protein LOC111445486 [Cucurbita moschata]|uniref:Uncharacterized protein LOC111445486 n=1 Tax=Cucurbita moschata TaxID=3662 RepID=A0A6J1FHV2_CUCMO|nr:uncharacterized protein LOC111445486 [Cucurbita moschata]XP_022939660.1 uncharacterized protein LOC111445486 [Cucurbita moschata]